MAYTAFSWGARVTGNGPHFYLTDTGTGVITPITLDPGTYYFLAPDLTGGLSPLGTASIFTAINNALAPYGVSFSFPALSGAGSAPDWWTMRKALLSAGAYTLRLAASSDAAAIARVAGWYMDSDATPDTMVELQDGDYLRTPVTVWWAEGGLIYPHDIAGFPRRVEERHVGQYGDVAVLAGAPVRELDITVAMVEGTNALRLIAESGGLPADTSLFSTGPLMAEDAQHHAPSLYVRADDAVIYAQGLSASIQAADIKQSVQGWQGLYDVTLYLTGVQDVSADILTGGFTPQF